MNYGVAKCENLIYCNAIPDTKKTINVKDQRLERKFNPNLKLLAIETLFINRYVKLEDKPIKIIYIGCSPGFHLSKLIEMYDFIYFDLYDPVDCCIELKLIIQQNKKVKFYKEKFTIETCSRYEDDEFDIYLITDYRDEKYNNDLQIPTGSSADFKRLRHKFQMQKEASYLDDMILQRDICKVLNPKYACLRFRPPHFYNNEFLQSPNGDFFPYFYGTVWLLLYNDLKSTESRLIVNNYDDDNYNWNYENYQYRLNYFNGITRETSLKNPFTGNNTPLPNQLGNRFETMMLFLILREYLQTIGYESPRVSDVMTLYTDFLIVEQCSKKQVCVIEEEKKEKDNNEIKDFDVNDLDVFDESDIV